MKYLICLSLLVGCTTLQDPVLVSNLIEKDRKPLVITMQYNPKIGNLLLITIITEGAIPWIEDKKFELQKMFLDNGRFIYMFVKQVEPNQSKTIKIMFKGVGGAQITLHEFANPKQDSKLDERSHHGPIRT